MDNEYSWTAFYPEAARNYDESSTEVSHMAEVIGVAALKYGTRPAIRRNFLTGPARL